MQSRLYLHEVLLCAGQLQACAVQHLCLQRDTPLCRLQSRTAIAYSTADQPDTQLCTVLAACPVLLAAMCTRLAC